MLPYQHGVRENAGFRLSPKIADRRDAAEGEGIRDRRLRRRLRSRLALRAQPRLRRLRRALPAPRRAARVRDPAGPRGGRRQGGARVVPRRRRASRGSCGCTSTIRTRRTSPPKDYKEKFPDDLYLGEVAVHRRVARAAARGPSATSSRRRSLVVTGDHGEARGDHGELTHGLFCYEATLHVPLFVWCPDLVAARAATPSAARHIDILPTMLDALGEREAAGADRPVAAPAGRDGGAGGELLRGALGRVQPRLGAAAGHRVRTATSTSICRSRSSTTCRRIRRRRRTSSPRRPDSLRRLRKRLLELPGRARRSAARSDPRRPPSCAASGT